MTVKIQKSNEIPKTVLCNKHGVKLEYTSLDVQHVDRFDDDDAYNYINCPKGNHRIEVKQAIDYSDYDL